MGQSVIGRYQVDAEIGRGASGTVYRGRREDLGRQVAIKVLAERLMGDAAFRKVFREEARILASINHPNVVELYEFTEEESSAYIVAEYIDGLSLRRVVSHAQRLTPEQALGVLKGALSGLGHAHASGLVHQDVKPDNILVNREGTSKLVDFGQAVRLSDGQLTSSANLGSPAYMSPEQCQGRPVDNRSDLYGAGVLLFELLTGHLPYAGAGGAQLMRKHVSAPIPDPRTLNADLPEPVAAMVMKAMAKDPADRFADADAFLLALEAAAIAGYGEDWEKRSSIKVAVAGALAGAGFLAGLSGAISGALGGGAALPLLAGGVLAAVAGGIALGILGHNAHPGGSASGPVVRIRVDGGTASTPASPINPAPAQSEALLGSGSAPVVVHPVAAPPRGATGGTPALPVASGGTSAAGTGSSPGTGSGTGGGGTPPPGGGGTPAPGGGSGGGGGGTPPPGGGGTGGLLPTVLDVPTASMSVAFNQCSALRTPHCDGGAPISANGHGTATTAYPLFGGALQCTAAQGYPLLEPNFTYTYRSGSRPIPFTVTWSVFDSTGIPALDPILLLTQPTSSGPGSGANYEYHYAAGLSYAYYSLTWLDDAGPHGPAMSPRFYWSC